MAISQQRIFQTALRFIDSAEEPNSRAGEIFSQVLCELAEELDHNRRAVESFISDPIARAALSSQRLLAKFSRALQRLGAEGVALPSPAAIARGSYRKLFEADIARVKQFALETIECTIHAGQKENRHLRLNYRG